MSEDASYVGLTWDHPRGYVALEQAAERARKDGLSLRWERQPLEGFESHPIEELAERYDIVVIDHPHLGDAVQAECFQPLESIFSSDLLDAWRAQSIGRSFESYRYAGRHWALPLDAASQVAVARTDLLAGVPPRDWTAAVDLAKRIPVCLSLAGPHALLTLFSLSTALGAAPLAAGPDRLLGGDCAVHAWETLRELHDLSFKGWSDKNPIGILNAMARSDAVVYCPLVFGYVNYAASTDGGHALHFVDVPAGPAGVLGSTLGGTGLAVSRRTEISEELRRHLVGLLSAGMQTSFIPRAQGQPSARAAWSDTEVNAAWNNFFTGTKATLEQAVVRPRHPGYVPFQNAASALVRDGLDRGHSASKLFNAIQSLYAAHRPPGSEV